MRRQLCLLICSLLIVMGTGCACNHAFTACGGSSCASGCGTTGCGAAGCAQPIPEPGPMAPTCTDCGEDACSCDVPSAGCETCAEPMFSIAKPRLLHAFFGCTGCGEEYYWSEWYSDPPNCCDPCDDHGNFTGYEPGQGPISVMDP